MEKDLEEISEEQNNGVLYTLIGLLVVIIALILYIYMSFNIIKKSDFKQNYIKKDDIVFSDIASFEQDKYILVEIFDNKILNLKNKLEECSVTPIIQEKIVEVEKIIEIEKIIEVEKIVEVEKSTPTQTVKTNKYNSYMCKEMLNGTFYLPKSCQNNLTDFLNTNKDASFFKVIGLVDKKEFALLNRLKQKEDIAEVTRISSFTQLGLSRKRVVEATWDIKKHLGENTKIEVVNYTITSNKQDKGFIVRAYK